MQKRHIFALLPILLLAGCVSSEPSSSSSQAPQIDYISEIKTTASGKTYYSLDDKPVTPIGIQVRVDMFLYKDNFDWDQMDTIFEKAAGMGVSMVELPIPWSSCETSEGVYTFRDLGKLLNLANKYGLLVEILTFGANTTGWSGEVPAYVKNDEERFPRYHSTVTPSGLFMVQDDEDLLEREGKWIEAMMDAVASWSASNEGKHIVSAVQVLNEADVFSRFVLTQQNIMTVDGTRRLTDLEAWEETLHAYDYLGKIVKNSAYPCITRVNLAQAYKQNWEQFCYDVFNLEGIDIVGDDIYEQTVGFTKNVIKDFADEDVFGGKNFPHVSENDGSYATTPSLILAANAMGGGYDIYDLLSSPYGINTNGWDDWGILAPNTMADKGHTQLTRDVIRGLKMAGSDLCLADKEDIAAFNLKTNLPDQSKTQTIQTTDAMISFTTSNGALAYAITSDTYIDVWASGDSTFSFANVTIGNGIGSGHVTDEGVFVKASDVSLNQGVLNVSANTFYRIPLESIDSQLASNTVRNIA